MSLLYSLRGLGRSAGAGNGRRRDGSGTASTTSSAGGSRVQCTGLVQASNTGSVVGVDVEADGAAAAADGHAASLPRVLGVE